MKKQDLTTLAMLGISSGLIVSGCQKGSWGKRETKPEGENSPSENHLEAAEEMMADMKSFYDILSPENKKKFNELDARHKMMAIEMVNQSCKGENKCAGLGGCKTSKHSCAGQNACKGQGGAPIRDPNKAVEVQYKNQQSGK